MGVNSGLYPAILAAAHSLQINSEAIGMEAQNFADINFKDGRKPPDTSGSLKWEDIVSIPEKEGIFFNQTGSSGLAAGMARLISAERNFQANAQVIRCIDETTGYILNSKT